jgi:4-amino-4-deoxy-L-arabinose transferase-like glycosyltransferase
MMSGSAAGDARPVAPPPGPIARTRWLWIIVAAAGILRFFPIWFGLPYLHARPDEGAAIGHAAAMLEGDLNPHFFHWPSLTFYLFAAFFAVASRTRELLTSDATLTPAEQILIGRSIVAAAGTLTVVVVARIGTRIGDAATGLLAAAFLAVAILHVRDSHFAMTDVLMTGLLTASLMVLLRALDQGIAEATFNRVGKGTFALAGFLGGLAASTKYSAAAVVLAMAAAQLVLWVRFRRMPWLPSAWLPALAFATAFWAGFLAGTPYAVLDFATFSADVVFDVTHLSGGHGIDLGRGWIYHLTTTLPYGVGLLTCLAAAGGFVALAVRSPRHALVLGIFAAGFYGSIGSGRTVFFRYVLPLVPIVCLFAAAGVRAAGRWVASRAAIRAEVATLIVGAIVAAPAAVSTVWFDLLLARTDTRVLAARWLAPRVAAGETLYDSGGDYATLDLGPTRYHAWRYDPAAHSFGHPEGDTPDWLVLHQSPLRTYGNHAPALRRLAGEQYDLVWEIRATRGAAARAVYDLQDAFFMPVSGFQTVNRPGPTIRIYRKRGGG